MVAIIRTNEQCSAVNIIYPYQTQEVRDLAAACFSPPLLHIGQLAGERTGITASTLQLSTERRLWLERLDRDASALLEHLSRHPTHRLGVYFEQLWHFFLQQDPATELIAHNLPIFDERRTVGEFDCIYYSHQQQCHVHLELAVKYFLGIPRTTNNDAVGSAHQWLGLDTLDRLDTKLDQLLQRQSLLGENAAARRKLDDLGIGELAREVALKGCLFQPVNALPLPPAYNTDCEPGTWVELEELSSYCATRDAAMYIVLPKMRWLCTARCIDSRNALDATQLRGWVTHYFERDTYPLLVAAINKNSIEVSRFFVTPTGWPESTRHRQKLLLTVPGR